MSDRDRDRVLVLGHGGGWLGAMVAMLNRQDEFSAERVSMQHEMMRAPIRAAMMPPRYNDGMNRARNRAQPKRTKKKHMLKGCR